MAIYVNRTYDSVASALVRWNTATPDTVGATYPGPGVFGVTATDYCVEDIVFTATLTTDFRNDFITGETVTGTDSVLSQSLSAIPSDDESVLIIYNRQALSQGQDFTISGTAITWLASSGTAPDLIASDTLFIYYVVDSDVLLIDFINDFVTGEVITGTDTALTATLSNTPSDADSVICVYNRQVMSQGQDYTVSGVTITWLASSGTAPDLVASDTLQFYYVINTTGGGGGGATAFTALTDTPGNFAGAALQTVRVNAGETALEFTPAVSPNPFSWANPTKTALYTASASETVPLDPSSGGFTVNLPAGPTLDDRVKLVNLTSSANTITINGNGNLINGLANYPMVGPEEAVEVSYNGTNWFIL